MTKAVFLDRDGVITKTVPVPGRHSRTPWTWEEFGYLPGVRQGLALLGGAGFLRIMISNQPDVVLGPMTEEIWSAIERRVEEECKLDDVYICKHHPKIAPCECRKPSPSMLLHAAKKWDIDLASSWMIGDTRSDVDAGIAAGCRTIIIDSDENKEVSCDYRAKDLLEAANNIIASL